MAVNALTNEQARKTLEQILNTPEFTQRRLLDDFIELIRKLLKNAGVNENLEGTGLLLEGLVFLAGLILAIYLARAAAPFWKIMVRDVKNEQVLQPGYIRPTPAGLLLEAEKNALQGDFRNALREIYLSLLMELDIRRLITYEAAKTNSEYLQEIGLRAAGLKELFQSMVNLFEYKWYGLENCGREDFQKGRELYAALLKDGPHG